MYVICITLSGHVPLYRVIPDYLDALRFCHRVNRTRALAVILNP